MIAQLDDGASAELERSLAQLAPRLDPARATGFIIALAEGQMPGAELRSVFFSIAAAALLGAAALKEHKTAPMATPLDRAGGAFRARALTLRSQLVALEERRRALDEGRARIALALGHLEDEIAGDAEPAPDGARWAPCVRPWMPR